MIVYKKRIDRRSLRNFPDVLFVFGDNFQEAGYGGQAKDMRGEPNAVGIPTKRTPSNQPAAFLKDEDYLEWVDRSRNAWDRLENHTGIIVWPMAGIGTGLAKLQESSPVIFHEIQNRLKILELLRK